MPSKGNPIIKFRAPAQFIEEIDLAIARRNLWSREEPWTLSRFLFIAAAEKLDKMRRSRRNRGRRRATPAAAGPSERNAEGESY